MNSSHRCRRQIRPHVVALLAAALSACSPADDWREMQPSGTGLSARFPCKPDAQSRGVVLAGASVSWTMHACQVGEVTFAVAGADVGDPARVGPALRALTQSSAANLGLSADAVPAAQPVTVPGMTPQPDAGRRALAGRSPRGDAVRLTTLVASRGTRIVQASVLGPAPSEAAVQTFLEGLRFLP